MAATPKKFVHAKESQVSVSVVRAMVDTAESKGIAREKLLSAARLDPRSLNAPNGQMARSQVYRLFEVALDLSANETLGLHWGSELQDQALVVVSQLVKYAPTLRQAFETLVRFSRLLADDHGTQMVERENWVTVRYIKPADASIRVQRFLGEMTMAGVYTLIRSYSPSGQVKRVAFDYPAPSYSTAYNRVFDGAERFDQTFTGIQFDRALMSVASPYNDEDLQCALRCVAERRLMQVTDCIPYHVRAHDVLARQVAPQLVPMRQVARKLGVSVRSLRRRLAEEGISYRDISNEACSVVAERLIAMERRTIQEAAYAMGFSDANAFHRAFKRWTGSTPAEFRRARTH